MSDNEESKWAYRLAGIGFVTGTVWGFIESDGEILGSLFTGAGVALGVLILWFIISFIISCGISIASEQTNPFKQGLGFAFGIVIALTVLDLAFFGGIFLIQPFFTLLFGGDWSQSYWGCMEHWKCVEEGCWCGRQD